MALLVLGLAGAVLRDRRGWLYGGTLAASGIGAVLAFAALVSGGGPASMYLPVGLPGFGLTLALDGLSGFFLLLLFVTASAASAFAVEQHDRGAAPVFPLFVGGMALTLLAGDAFALLLGFELMSLASWALVLTYAEDAETRAAALLYIGMASLGAVSILAALALLAPTLPGGFPDLRFAAMRDSPPEGWRAVAVLALVLLGAGSKAGLVPLHVWLPPAHVAAPSHVSALMSGAMTKVALYVMIRVLFDLAGGAQPAWWGAPLLAMGALSAVLGALRATMEPDLKSVLACSTVENVGLIAIGLGTALAARGSDLLPLASLALAAALLHAMAHGLFKSLLFLGAGAVQHGAETRMLHRLGGLIHRMPFTTACVLVGAAGMAALPPGPGFAGEWLLLQSVLAGPRMGGVALQTAFAVVVALIALAVALAATAAVRLVGVAFLGRPRTPRTAAAEEAGPWARAAMFGLAGLALLVGLFPGAVLALAGPALRQLLGATMANRIGPLAVVPQADIPGYSPLAVAFLLALAGVGTVAVLRARAVRGERRGAAWECGFAAPPPWLPFGDPATQYGAASFSQILRRTLGGAVLAAEERVDIARPGETAPARASTAFRDPAEAGLFAPVARLRAAISMRLDRLQFLTIRRTLSVMFATFVLFLAMIAWLEAS